MFSPEKQVFWSPGTGVGACAFPSRAPEFLRLRASGKVCRRLPGGQSGAVASQELKCPLPAPMTAGRGRDRRMGGKGDPGGCVARAVPSGKGCLGKGLSARHRR